MHLDIPGIVFVGAAIGAGTGAVLSGLFSLIGAVMSDFISFGGIGSCGQAFSWKSVGQMTWRLARIFVPVGLVLGGVIVALLLA